jgi:hypothetical protein
VLGRGPARGDHRSLQTRGRPVGRQPLSSRRNRPGRAGGRFPPGVRTISNCLWRPVARPRNTFSAGNVPLPMGFDIQGRLITTVDMLPPTPTRPLAGALVHGSHPTQKLKVAASGVARASASAMRRRCADWQRSNAKVADAIPVHGSAVTTPRPSRRGAHIAAGAGLRINNQRRHCFATARHKPRRFPPPRFTRLRSRGCPFAWSLPVAYGVRIPLGHQRHRCHRAGAPVVQFPFAYDGSTHHAVRNCGRPAPDFLPQMTHI